MFADESKNLYGECAKWSNIALLGECAKWSNDKDGK
jgi:hypothetical protein